MVEYKHRQHARKDAIDVYDKATNKVNFKVKTSGKTIIGDKIIISGSHTDALLTVNGKIVAKEVVVILNNWADYVFDKNYKLLNLENLEHYIK